MKIVGVIVSRMTSNRLPGKALVDLAGKPSIERHIERLRMVKGISDIYIATSKSEKNKPLFEQAERLDVNIYAGSEEDIVERFISVGKLSDANAFVRIGCDKPLFCYELLQKNINEYQGEDYVYFNQPVAKGVTHEILSLKALSEVHKYYHGTAIAQYIREHPHRFDIRPVDADSIYKRPEYRLDLDTKEDYRMLSLLFEELQSQSPISTSQALMFLDDNPEIALIHRIVEEKNVNLYSSKLGEEPVFKVVMNNSGKYLVFDRMEDFVEYKDFVKCVLDKNRWKR